MLFLKMPSGRLLTLATVALVAGAAGACSSGGGGGYNRVRPNELAVMRAAPLVVPPDFNLSPPAPGQPRPQDVDSSAQALAVMFGGPVTRTPGEGATVSAAGGSAAEGGIRSTVGDPQTQTVNKGQVTTDVINAPESDGQAARVSVPKSQ